MSATINVFLTEGRSEMSRVAIKSPLLITFFLGLRIKGGVGLTCLEWSGLDPNVIEDHDEPVLVRAPENNQAIWSVLSQICDVKGHLLFFEDQVLTPTIKSRFPKGVLPCGDSRLKHARAFIGRYCEHHKLQFPIFG